MMTYRVHYRANGQIAAIDDCVDLSTPINFENLPFVGVEIEEKPDPHTVIVDPETRLLRPMTEDERATIYS